MSTSRNRAFLFTAFACGLALAACGDSAPTPTASDAAAPKKPAPKVAGLAPEMVAAVSAGKAATVISVHFALGTAPAVSKALPVEIAIVPHQEFTSVRAHFESHEGVALITGENFGPVSDSQVEKAISHHLVLLPSKEGVFMITTSVETEGPDGTVTRIFSIPIIVAPAPAPTPAPASPAAPSATPSANP